jgi:quinoprotein glucose dehydrogenase
MGWIEAKVSGGDYGTGNGSPQPYDRGSIGGPGPYATFSALGMPCQKPPWGSLIAIDVRTGDVAWRATLGLHEELPEGKRETGNAGAAGAIVTAGGVVLVGATWDHRFRAFDAQTGRALWTTRLARDVQANPIAYRGADGREYVAVVATDEVVAFALPE